MSMIDDIKRGPMFVHLCDADKIVAALIAADELAAMLENCLEVLTKEDGRLCCDGRECGCYGATKHQEAEHYAKEALAAYRAAVGARK
jgi:hypothetical protein